ncbi:MAG: response regulator [Lachnospirales bacterium]
MYKLIIVDDEETEREGLRSFIDWKTLGIEVCDTAWNGIDAFEKIQKYRPDIVMTDINMPVMDGIELIKKITAILPNIIFIVLSGYGEYSFTSQVMEEGVKYYILKPYTKNKIQEILKKVKDDIEENRKKTKIYDFQHKMLPYAKSQIFRNILLDEVQSKLDNQIFLKELNYKGEDLRLIAFYIKRKAQYSDLFILVNIMEDLIGQKNVVISTYIKECIYLLIHEMEKKEIIFTLERTIELYGKIFADKVLVGVSGVYGFNNIGQMYNQVNLTINLQVHKTEISFFSGNKGLEKISTIQLWKFTDIKDIEKLMYDTKLLLVKMELKKSTVSNKRETLNTILSLNNKSRIDNIEDVNLFSEFIRRFLEGGGGDFHNKNEILQMIYSELGNLEFSVKYMARNVVFVNEDYFGRLFYKLFNEKFTSYVIKVKVNIAKDLFKDNPNLKVGEVAEVLGFSADGQYFSKVFKKYTKKSPSDFKNGVRLN